MLQYVALPNTKINPDSSKRPIYVYRNLGGLIDQRIKSGIFAIIKTQTTKKLVSLYWEMFSPRAIGLRRNTLRDFYLCYYS